LRRIQSCSHEQRWIVLAVVSLNSAPRFGIDESGTTLGSFDDARGFVYNKGTYRKLDAGFGQASLPDSAE